MIRFTGLVNEIDLVGAYEVGPFVQWGAFYGAEVCESGTTDPGPEPCGPNQRIVSNVMRKQRVISTIRAMR